MLFFRLLAGRTHAVNREFVYIDFDDERFPPCERRGGSGGPFSRPEGDSGDPEGDF